MLRRFSVVFVLMLCVFFVFFFAPFGEEAEQATEDKNQNNVLFDGKVVSTSIIK